MKRSAWLRRGAFSALVAIATSTTACFQVDYLLQAGEGQLDLMCRARAIEGVIQSEDTDPRVRELLAEVAPIKEFAKRFGLTPTSSYEDYVALDRGAVVYVVSAAPPLSFEAKTWSFPIAGSVPYVGYFQKHLAQIEARRLAEDGWDVDLRGASAYSTLGWFPDPVLSSMLDLDPGGTGDLADTILHESLHATVYVQDQSGFNESLATFVGHRLAVTYVTERYGAESPEVLAFAEGEVRGKERAKRLHQAVVDLEKLYASKLPREEKLAAKDRYLLDLREELDFARPITNATLAGFRTYHGGDSGFDKLFEACGRDMRRFIAASRRVEPGDFPKPHVKEYANIVSRLAARGCPGKPERAASSTSGD